MLLTLKKSVNEKGKNCLGGVKHKFCSQWQNFKIIIHFLGFSFQELLSLLWFKIKQPVDYLTSLDKEGENWIGFSRLSWESNFTLSFEHEKSRL